MTRKKLGLYLPPKETLHHVWNAGVLSPAAIDEITGLLKQDDRVECHMVDLSRAYIRSGKVYDGELCLSDLDLFAWFYSLPSDLLSYDLKMLKTLAGHTRVVPDPFGVERGIDKYASHTLLNHAGLPTAEFALFRSNKVGDMTFLLDEWEKLLLKPVLGSFGHGVSLIKSKQQMIDSVEYAASFHKDHIDIFCERFEPNDLGEWISATIINGELMYGYRKKPERIVEDWKVYDAGRIGGAVDYVDASPVADIALAAARVIGADVIGFDCIFSKRLNKYLIVDENTLPGLYPHCFTASGKSGFPEYYVRMVLSKL